MQCEAVAEKTGQQCRRDAMRTGTVCIMHAVPNADPNLPVKDLRIFDKSGRRCGARTRKGTPCAKFAIPGGSVCPSHGGRGSDARRKARERLLDLVHPAIAELSRIVQNDTSTDSDKLKAIQMILDRGGFHAKQEIEVEVRPWQGLLNGIVIEDGAQEPEPVEAPDPYAADAVVAMEDEDTHVWSVPEPMPEASNVRLLRRSPEAVPEHLR